MFALGQIISVRLKSRPKFKPTGRSRNTTRETLSRGRPRTTLTPRRARPAARAGNKPRGRATVRVPRPMHPSEPGKNVPRPAENHRPNLIRRPRRPTVNPSGHDRSDSATTRCPADRPDRPSQRRGRPEARFEAQFHIFKPGLTLSRLKRPSTIYIAF
ncbi:unnamed protein product [Microthlaspi erraticum]|uniref:Uncharacterized protein n=1 Tax=Microthlaspi erraticum TaxID=1685480 RepID=A0A6D2KCQ7_9BRAS|nr:unnamed protein product [Microthlaspi erraticum]